MEVVHTSSFEFSAGRFIIASTKHGLAYVGLPKANGRGLQGWLKRHAKDAKCVEDQEVNRRYVDQILEYLEGARREFSLPLDLRGTDFQKAVYEELKRIPYGETCSYGDIARRIGRGAAVRAVGTANGSNPLALVIPCHRVVAAGGKLGGYAGGKRFKARLLAMESSATQTGRLL